MTQTFKTFGKLPSRPSELIRLALKDLKATEKDSRYIINMELGWHSVMQNTCMVCLAGSVMAKSLGCNPFKTLWAHDLNEGWALEALDWFRQGQLSRAFLYLDIEPPKKLKPTINIVDYDADPELFKKQLKRLADKLAERGY